MLLAQYFAQFLVLGFTIYVWWAARRDLALRAEQMSGPAALKEWERLQEAVQTLIADLEGRATVTEERVAAAERRMADAQERTGVPAPHPLTHWEKPPAPAGPAPDAAKSPPDSVAEHAGHDERYAPAYALADAGVSDVAEIVRRTGLGHGEVALILGLRARQSPR